MYKKNCLYYYTCKNCNSGFVDKLHINLLESSKTSLSSLLSCNYDNIMKANASVLTMTAVGGVWFLTSAILSTWANSTFLNTFKDPLLHTLIRFFGSAVMSMIYLLSTGEVQKGEIVEVVLHVILPAVLLWIANYFNSISLNLAGITLTYVVKACIPVFTVIVCAIGGQKFPLSIYFSLLPICLGVALASGSDLDFTLYGLLAAFTSAFAQTLMNISIKAVRAKTNYSGPKAFMGMTVVSTFLTVLVVAVEMLRLNANDFIVHGAASTSSLILPQTLVILSTVCSDFCVGNTWPLVLIFISSFAYHVEYMLNFVFVGYVNSVMFSVADIARRVAIIVVGALVFDKVLTGRKWAGIVMALSGVLLYSYLNSVHENQQKGAARSGNKAQSGVSATTATMSTATQAAVVSGEDSTSRNSEGKMKQDK